LELRRRTQNKSSLDTLLREMYRAFPLSGPGFTQEDLQRAAERLSVSSFREFFADYITGTRPLDFEGALAVAGLQTIHDAGADAAAAPTQRAYVGLRLSPQDGLGSVSAALADGPAYKAGINAGDLLVSLNGQRVRSTTDLDSLLKTIKPGDSVRLTFFR